MSDGQHLMGKLQQIRPTDLTQTSFFCVATCDALSAVVWRRQRDQNLRYLSPRRDPPSSARRKDVSGHRR
ncbi:hypothetical protein LshimejAT787_0100330 [Lyophyllum shimeji]|uniref:Uncharacterized protein n=1 Tax=Lyophyllum shimeji TaxID=47721 RepID=A0A9P3PCH5_LYOSH|nr:hypothetical protein LshimejAT787_0100330 [Lyophyllum shimeji]